MNFLDPYDIAGPSAAQTQPEQSLNEEVSEVIGSIGRFWGGFRKQSQTVFQTAVTQAQQELNKLKGDAHPSDMTQVGTERSLHGEESELETRDSGESAPGSSQAASASSHHESPPATATTQTLFSRLQSALPPNIVTAVTSNLPDSLRHASENIDVAQLRVTLLTEFQRVQGVTRTQAEEYAHKSEAMLREAVKEAGEVIRDAVKIIPPEGTERSGLIWDGTDMWSLPEVSEIAPQEATDDAKLDRGPADAQLAVATRAESLLRRLKHDPTIIQHDPAADPGIKEVYFQWISSEIDTKEGGVEGKELSAKISALLDEPGSGLRDTQATLVPSELTSTVFWTRYFFRAHQIEAEEEKRKLLIEGTLDDDDFSWEDDEEEIAPIPGAPTQSITISTSTPHITSDQLPKDTPSNLTNVPSDTSISTHTTASTAARQSSEDSFDVVPSRIASPSTHHDIPDSAHHDSDEPDSDWE